MKTKILFIGAILLTLCLVSCDKKIKTYKNYGVERGAITNAIFIVNPNGDQVCFAQGNLQLRGRKYRFAKNQQDVVENPKRLVDKFTGKQIKNIKFRKGWRILTIEEWKYLLSHHTHRWAIVCGVEGVLLFPIKWEEPNGVSSNQKEYREDDWKMMQMSGAVFLPVNYPGGIKNGSYWSSTVNPWNECRDVFIFDKDVDRRGHVSVGHTFRNFPPQDQQVAIRLVRDIK